MDELGVASASYVGISYGGFVAGRLIAVAPERVRRTLLLVPGVVGMHMARPVMHMLVWQVLYGVTGMDRFFRRMMDGLFTDYDDDVREFFRVVMTQMRIDRRQMKLSTPEECRSFEGPLFVIGAENNVIFNCDALRARVGELYPHAVFHELKGSMHSPSVQPRSIRILNLLIADLLVAS